MAVMVVIYATVDSCPGIYSTGARKTVVGDLYDHM